MQPYNPTGQTGTHAGHFRASTLIGYPVVNPQRDDLGEIQELVIDSGGCVTYAVLSFGGFLGMGDKLFAIPWNLLSVDHENRQCILNVDREMLERAPGFNKDNWPDMADPQFGSSIDSYYGTERHL